MSLTLSHYNLINITATVGELSTHACTKSSNGAYSICELDHGGKEFESYTNLEYWITGSVLHVLGSYKFYLVVIAFIDCMYGVLS